jgi:predicted kinase
LPRLKNLLTLLATLAITLQDPRHHAEGDVWTHTKLVVEALRSSEDYSVADEDGRFILFYSALLHDIAKAACTRLEPDGRITSPGHSRRGSIDARILLWRANVPFALREAICRIIAVHQLPFFALSGDREGHRPEYLIHWLSWELPIAALCAVAEADMRGRLCADQQTALDEIALFREMAKEEGCLVAPKVFPDPHTRLTYFRSEGTIAPDYPFHQNAGSKVVVLSGLPASGKNTWVAAQCPELPVISFDDAREELGLKHGRNAGAAVHLATDHAKALLRTKSPFIWNATHLSGQMRKKTLDLLYAYDAEVEIVYLESPERVIKSRNRRRDTTLTNAGIEKMLFRWEVPSPIEAHVVNYCVECEES